MSHANATAEEPIAAYQEAHEVKGENSWHATKRQALQNGAADSGRVAVVPGAGVGAVGAARLAAPKYPHGDNQHSENPQSHIPAENLRR